MQFGGERVAAGGEGAHIWSMNAYSTTAYTLLAIASILGLGTLSAQSDATEAYHPILLGPRYRVDLIADAPVVTWDDVLAPERLVATSDTTGFLIDDGGMPKLLLAWGRRFDNLDAAYTKESYFAWALAQVAEGRPWGRDKTDDGDSPKKGAPVWDGKRWPYRDGEEGASAKQEVIALPQTVRINEAGHDLVFTRTEAGVTATDNGAAVEVTGGNGNYRVYGVDYEAGVAFRQNGKVWQYFKEL